MHQCNYILLRYLSEKNDPQENKNVVKLITQHNTLIHLEANPTKDC